MKEQINISNRAISLIANESKVKNWQVESLYKLFSEDATIPFIARYRKEVTGGLDEVVIEQIKKRFSDFEELEKRRSYIVKSLTDRELITDELLQSINNTLNLNELEDIFMPFKPKRRTRAAIAREKGLAPLAKIIFSQSKDIQLHNVAYDYVQKDKGVLTVEDALNGASDIIAEIVSEDKDIRKQLRNLFLNEAVLTSTLVKKNKDKGEKFKDYFDWKENITKIPSHRILAILRGENEEILRVKICPDKGVAERILSKKFLKTSCNYKDYIIKVLSDSYIRLIAPSLENELRVELKLRADNEAVRVFAQNLRELLMASPFGGKSILAIDPGVRTGCKVVALNERGDLLNNTVIYPDRKHDESESIIRSYVNKYSAQAIAIGNGTYGRETESFVRGLKLTDIDIVMVNESGASIYSASEVAREEFPDYDLTVRGAVSIGRRLMDPLAELVKIDPKSIGVGQYQHDVDQVLLKNSLDSVVMSCVNAVGVELNTASRELLTYVSGLGNKLAANIIEYRKINGTFKSRKELLKVPRLGAKAYEQAAGFIRVSESKNPLDRSAVHPESYDVVEKMAHDKLCEINDFISNNELCNSIDLGKYITETRGLPTLTAIIDELKKPGRDPREKFIAFSFSNDVNTINDLSEGIILPGIVTNVTDFGAFVDIGVHQDGLVHISQLADKYVKNPNDIVKVQQHVKVKIIGLDPDRKRISLSMKL